MRILNRRHSAANSESIQPLLFLAKPAAGSSLLTSARNESVKELSSERLEDPFVTDRRPSEIANKDAGCNTVTDSGAILV